MFSGIIKTMNKVLEYTRNILFQIAVSALLNIISWVVIITQIKPNAEPLPLHYNVFFGPDIVTKGYYLYSLPLVGLLILVANYIFYRYTKEREEFAAKIVIAVTMVVQALILIAVLFLKSIIVI
ncbi:MAG: Uncharacterized protein G01um101477_267 [Candidatus Doudnabacteria bacterium Gr01-1014_77]|uniref:DUF1648 domain-containing protein n=1 Tax=Candidatus Doudnabacteria bacterium Gr01-1014_77 TaxID=2017133 RepID=A0A554JCC6_9BACT|nr:MAG: Uncharacterized protein G01um101477_267 [Candidatus Doudnabacteria bacterium Gr01-1014_77]